MAKGKSTQPNKLQKKKPTKEDLSKFVVDDVSEQLQKPKRRLRKLQKHESSQEEFIPDKQMQEEQAGDDHEDEQFDRFRVQDDSDIEKEKQLAQKKKKSKKMKNNQEIDKFMENMPKSKKQQKKAEKKQQEANIQTNIVDFFKMQHLKKSNKPPKQPTPVQSDQDDNNDESMSDGEALMRAMKAQNNYYKEFQGNVARQTTEDDLVKQAIKLSLQSAKKEKSEKMQEEHVNLNDFTFDEKVDKKKENKQVNIKNDPPRKLSKQVQKHDEKKTLQKSKSKKTLNKKQPNQGALGDQVIVFTGEFQPYNKDELIQLCQKLGASTPKSFAKGTTVLFQGAYVVDQWKKKLNQDITTTTKSRLASQKGIKIVAHDDLDNYFIQKTGKSLAEHFSKNPAHLDGFVEKINDETNAKMEVEIADPNLVKDQVNRNQAGFGVLWTEKYKPKTLDDVVGQSSQIKTLREWLKDWEDVVLKGNKKSVQVKRGGFLPSGNMNSRAALLSGDPGIGKTSTARLLAQQLNFDVVQFNASDIRNKKGVLLLESNSLGLHESSQLVKKLMIMDQVDGMSKGDRGGITEMINMIKQTTVPIICICNDRQSEKIRSLAGHCLDIKFHKPDKRLVRARLQQILKKQGGKASDLYLQRLVENFQNDMRQILNYLELAFSNKAAQMLDVKDATKIAHFTKDNAVLLTNFEATKKLLNRPQSMPLRQRMDCFFIDSDFVPIMVHENYLTSMKKGKLTPQDFKKLVKANDAFVLADLIDTRVRKQQDWGLMPAFGFMSSVYPSQMVAEGLGYPAFPSWLGKFSSERKHRRLLRELKHAVHAELPSTSKSVRFGLAELIYQDINFKLKHDQVQETLDMMETYNLTPDSMNEVLLQLQYNPNKNALFPDVTSSTKTKLTKAFNRRHEENKMKGKTKKVTVAAPEHQKYNEVLDEMSDDDVPAEEEEKSTQDDEVKMEKKEQKKQAKGGKKK